MELKKQLNKQVINIFWTHADLQISSKDVSCVILKYLSLQMKKEFLFMEKEKTEDFSINY